MKKQHNEDIVNEILNSYSKLNVITYEECLLKMGKLRFVTHMNQPNNTKSNIGSYIYLNRKKPNIAYKLYRGFDSKEFVGYQDDILLTLLIRRQPHILKTKFPTGIIVEENKIIGQEIPFFNSYKALSAYSGKNNKLIIIYKQILEAIKEMYENGIMYLDIHSKNFLVNSKLDVQTIDFEKKYIIFEDYSIELKKNILDRICHLINLMNQNYGILYNINQDDIEYFSDIDKQLIEMQKLMKR